MKTLLMLAIFCIITSCIKAENLIGKNFVTTVENVKVYPVDTLNDGKSYYYVHRNTKFTIVGIAPNNDLIISFWLYRGSEDNLEWPKPNVDTILNGKGEQLGLEKTGLGGGFLEREFKEQKFYFGKGQYIGPWARHSPFTLPLQSLNSSSQPFYAGGGSFNWGVMTLPIKLRFAHGDVRFFNFEEKINLGFAAGWKYQIPSRIDQSINILGGFGVAGVKTDKESLNEGFYDEDHLTGNAFSINIGLLYQYESFQVGCFLGKDFLASTLSKQWKYQHKTWLGLALGISLFGKQGVSEGVGNNKQ